MRMMSFLFVALFAPCAVFAQKGVEQEIRGFLTSGYTEGFSRGFEVVLRMTTKFDGISVGSTLTISQGPGAATRRFDREWIGALQNGHIVMEGGKETIATLNLFDPVTLRLAHSIDLNDLSMSSYEWTDFPKTMRLGETRTVGRVTERSKEDKVTAEGKVDFSLAKSKSGLEFCTIETTLEVGSKEKNVTRDCDLFDANRKIVGSRVEVVLGKNSKAFATGEIRIK